MDQKELYEMVRQTKEASASIGLLSADEKNAILGKIASSLIRESNTLIAENALDMEAAKKNGMSDAMLDRLLLTKERITSMAEGLRGVMRLPDPCGKILDENIRPNGLQIIKKSVPFGVIAMIYESRPNVTIDAAALCIKSGNACILRGGKEAHYTNQALTFLIQKAIEECGAAPLAVQSLLDPSHELVNCLLTMRGEVDLVIPRGGAGLIDFVIGQSTVPVIETGKGVCHTYVDRSADLEKAVSVAVNAKVQRPSVCNSMETLLVHADVAEKFLQMIIPVLLDHHVEIRGDEAVCALFPDVKKAAESDWSEEYDDYILSVKIVGSAEEAVRHIRTYGTHHSECIMAEDSQTIRFFMDSIDAAAVYANASTRFTDGFEFGFGAEIGISTQKLHVRGPMGLDALVTYTYEIFGDGQIRK